MTNALRWQPDPHPATFVGWLSFAQLLGWGSVFYAFSMLLTPVEAELGVTRGDVSLAMSLALLAEGLAAYPVGRWRAWACWPSARPTAWRCIAPLGWYWAWPWPPRCTRPCLRW